MKLREVEIQQGVGHPIGLPGCGDHGPRSISARTTGRNSLPGKSVSGSSVRVLKPCSLNRAVPGESGCVESFNGKLRNELLNREVFDTLNELQALFERWRVDKSIVRPHSVPSRRMRKSHTGLFGYSREIKEGIFLPRVISFCAVLYTMGLPPDILGLNALSKDDIKVVSSIYSRFDASIRDVLRFWNPDVLKILPAGIRKDIKKIVDGYDYEANEEYKDISGELLESLSKKRYGAHLTDLIIRAGSIRGFLG